MATCVLSLTGNNKLDIIKSGGAKTVAQLLVGHDFKTAQNHLPKLHAFPNMFAIGFFEIPKPLGDVEMTVAEKL